MLPKRIIVSFILIVIAYWFTYQEVEGTKLLRIVKPALRNPFHSFLFVFVGLVGSFGLSAYRERWVRAIWNISYLLVFFVIIITTILHHSFNIQNENFFLFTGSLRYFFTSPVPFGVLVFIVKKYSNLKNGQQNKKASF